MRNEYLAYCFLYDDTSDLRCDFEILSDEISSMIGLLRSLVSGEDLREDLSRLNELMYHINPSPRMGTGVSGDEFIWLQEKAEELRRTTLESLSGFSSSRGGIPKFVLPQGCTAASYSHVIRNRCKALVRLLSRHKQQGHKTDDLLFDFINLFSGYFYFLALKLNKDAGVEEREFKSRAYGQPE